MRTDASEISGSHICSLLDRPSRMQKDIKINTGPNEDTQMKMKGSTDNIAAVSIIFVIL